MITSMMGIMEVIMGGTDRDGCSHDNQHLDLEANQDGRQGQEMLFHPSA